MEILCAHNIFKRIIASKVPISAHDELTDVYN